MYEPLQAGIRMAPAGALRAEYKTASSVQSAASPVPIAIGAASVDGWRINIPDLPTAVDRAIEGQAAIRVDRLDRPSRSADALTATVARAVTYLD